jgi:hypothetical protein
VRSAQKTQSHSVVIMPWYPVPKAVIHGYDFWRWAVGVL